jgi:2-methylcitrate dehydratase PrpD
MARSAAGQETLRGFHSPGTQGPYAAAAAVGKLYGFDEDMLASALGIAGSSSAGLLEFESTGADTKRIHLGRASQLGLESALLARRGFSGPTTVLEGRAGYYNAFAKVHDLNALLEGLGSEWVMRPATLKSYPAHVTFQSVVQAIQRFRRARPLDPSAVTRVVVRGTPRMMESRHGMREPASVMSAQYSLPFTTAVALARDMDHPLAYDEAVVRDPAVRALALRVELVADQSMVHAGSDRFQAVVTIEHASETHTLTTEPSKGSPWNPLTWDDVCRKFSRSLDGLIDGARAAAIVEAVSELGQAEDAAPLARHLAG